jgi:proteasome accessory factor C
VSKFTAAERLTRLLAIIPHVAGRGYVSLDDLSARFSYPRADLVADLTDVLPYVGVAPFTPDTLIEVTIDEHRVRIDYADWFVRPLRLSPAEALALFAAGRTLVAAEPDDDAGPLVRGLTKLGAALGSGGDAPDGEPASPWPTLDIHVGSGAEETLGVLRAAVAEHRMVRIDYYSYGRDERRERVIEPHRFYADEGNWYVAGYCHLARADRVFRVDRMRSATLLDERFPAPASAGASLSTFAPSADDPRVVLDIAPDARWVVDQYPHDAVEQRADGVFRVTLPVTARPWLERLLVRLGPAAAVVEAPPGLGDDARRDAAGRILVRYTAAGTASSTGRDPEPHP